MHSYVIVTTMLIMESSMLVKQTKKSLKSSALGHLSLIFLGVNTPTTAHFKQPT